MLEDWFKECRENKSVKIFNGGIYDYIIYKGIKLEETNEGLRILDVRYNDFYNEVSKKDFRTLKKYGFVNGCDILMYNRDITRISRYTRRLEKSYTAKANFEKEFKKKGVDKRLILKKLGVLERKSKDLIDNLFFYRARKEQFEIKYK